MSDRARLNRMLKAAARPKPKRKIVCYDAKWAGLPRITVYDRPRRTKVSRTKQRCVAVRAPRPAPALQMVLPL